jgi:hypothetical protein
MPTIPRYIGAAIAAVALLLVIRPPGATDSGDGLLLLCGALAAVTLTPTVFALLWLAGGGRHQAVQIELLANAQAADPAEPRLKYAIAALKTV